MSCCGEWKKSHSEYEVFHTGHGLQGLSAPCVHFLCVALHVWTGSCLDFTSRAFWCFFSPLFHWKKNTKKNFFSLPSPSFFFFIFILFFIIIFFSLFPSCSLDAAKRKAWKLNRVGSLRNIYSSSSTNTEGNNPTCPRQTPPLSPPFFNPPLQNFPLLAPVPVPLEMRFAPSMRCLFPPRVCRVIPLGLFIFLFVPFVLPFMFLSAYLNFDLSL